jgi:hypothetical protein
MGDRRIGVIINGATGRMGTAQHMANLLAIAAEGGLKLGNGDRLIPDLLLVGRDAGRLAKLAAAHGNQRSTKRWTWRDWPTAPASSMASSRTSCSYPASPS